MSASFSGKQAHHLKQSRPIEALIHESSNRGPAGKERALQQQDSDMAGCRWNPQNPSDESKTGSTNSIRSGLFCMELTHLRARLVRELFSGRCVRHEQQKPTDIEPREKEKE
ncbi:hypothetical protein CDAR_63081 [Caerostris darwini]|uniref:Uncharacterized protein n=1 Tax=Caerostris darwini TaxID=1538125 RepID=A0AAV4UFC0_9ARAC|nr:hypothetical protein CDAR_63081 [Caerostris darwini]